MHHLYVLILSQIFPYSSSGRAALLKFNNMPFHFPAGTHLHNIHGA